MNSMTHKVQVANTPHKPFFFFFFLSSLLSFDFFNMVAHHDNYFTWFQRMAWVKPTLFVGFI